MFHVSLHVNVSYIMIHDLKSLLGRLRHLTNVPVIKLVNYNFLYRAALYMLNLQIYGMWFLGKIKLNANFIEITTANFCF